MLLPSFSVDRRDELICLVEGLSFASYEVLVGSRCRMAQWIAGFSKLAALADAVVLDMLGAW